MIVNSISGKKYIGSTGSSHGVRKRWQSHKSDLNKKIHSNPHLQAAWNKYGEQAFSYKVLELCPDSMLLAREEHWMAHHRALDPEFGYNLRTAERHSMSEESIRRMSASRIGHLVSPETRAKISVAMIGNQRALGHVHSAAARMKMSIAVTGRPSKLRGRKQSQEQISKQIKRWNDRREYFKKTEVFKKLVELYDDGWSLASISKELGRSGSWACKVAKRHELILR